MGERIVAPMNGTERGTAPTHGSIPQRRAYNVPEVAVLLGGVTERYVWTLLSTGELESVKIGARRLIPAEAIDAFIARLRADEKRVRAEAAAK